MSDMTDNEIEILFSRYRSCLMEAKRQEAGGLLTKAFNNKLFELVGEFCEALDIKPDEPRRIVRVDTITFMRENTAVEHRPLNLRQVKSPEPPLTDEEQSEEQSDSEAGTTN